MTPNNVRRLTTLLRRLTCFRRASELLETRPTYRPSINIDTRDGRELANLYDRYMAHNGDERRAYRWGSKS